MQMIILRDKQKVFYQYKIRVELSSQISLFEVDEQSSEREQKNMAVRRTFNFINSQETYIEFVSGRQEIAVINFQKINDDILIMKLARKMPVDLSIKGSNTFVDKKEDSYPCSFVIFDCKNQVVYVERVLKVFQLPNAMIKILQDMFNYINNQISENHGKNFYINIITREEDFMQCFNSFDIVNKISLKLDAPNCFLGNREADDLLNELRKETQTKKTELEFSSDEGLYGEGIYSQLKPFIEYAARGGGSYSMRGTIEGGTKQITKNSFNKIKTLNLTFNFNTSEDQIGNLSELVDKISNENNYEDDEE